MQVTVIGGPSPWLDAPGAARGTDFGRNCPGSGPRIGRGAGCGARCGAGCAGAAEEYVRTTHASTRTTGRPMRKGVGAGLMVLIVAHPRDPLSRPTWPDSCL